MVGVRGLSGVRWRISPFFPGIFSRRLSRIWLSLSRWTCLRSSALHTDPLSSPFFSAAQLSLGSASLSGSSSPGTSPGVCSWFPKTSSMSGRESSSWFKSFIWGFERSVFHEDLARKQRFKHHVHPKGQLLASQGFFRQGLTANSVLKHTFESLGNCLKSFKFLPGKNGWAKERIWQRGISHSQQCEGRTHLPPFLL